MTEKEQNHFPLQFESVNDDRATTKSSSERTDESSQVQADVTKAQRAKTFITKNDTRVKTHFDESEIDGRQEAWQHFEENSPESNYNLFPDYFYAGFWIRMWAFIIDLICISCITNGSLNLFYRLLNKEPQGSILSFYGLASLIIYLAYFSLLTKLNHGQTIGKMFFGIRVVSLVESELSWTTVLMRETVCRFILKTFPGIIGYLPSAFSKRKQHLGDYFCETSVVTLNVIKAFNKEISL